MDWLKSQLLKLIGFKADKIRGGLKLALIAALSVFVAYVGLQKVIPDSVIQTIADQVFPEVLPTATPTPTPLPTVEVISVKRKS